LTNLSGVSVHVSYRPEYFVNKIFNIYVKLQSQGHRSNFTVKELGIFLRVLNATATSVRHNFVFIEMAGRIQFFLADWLPSFYVLERNSGVSENDGSSLWNFVPNFRLEKFYYGT